MNPKMYDFDTVISREGTQSAKWNYAREKTGVAGVLPMWVADMDFETVPEVADAIRERALHRIYGYTQRSDGYYDAIRDWYRVRCGWSVDKSWITHSAGVVNALYTAVRALTEPGDGVLLQPPVYHPFYSAISRNGCRTILNPLKVEDGRYVLDLEDLERKLAGGNVKLFLLCNPHNPVGRVFTEAELRVMGELCLAYKVKVVSDEIHGDLVFAPHRHIPFASLSPEFSANAIVCTAPSKTFNLAGLSTSNIIIPDEAVRERFNKTAEDSAQKSFNLFGAVACEAAYRYGGEWLDQLLIYLDENKEYALRFFRERLPGLPVTEPEGMYFLWVDCRRLGLDNGELEQFLLQEAGVWFNQGHMFGPGGDGFVRINIGCPRALVEEGLSRLERAVSRLAAGAAGR
ncbi:MAG: class aminotransferase [Paenibacillaceae bacterium]|jgi:cystathionine beta-lyase|nr:class aminotransferase [Paenibacillaceae bacterium]